MNPVPAPSSRYRNLGVVERGALGACGWGEWGASCEVGGEGMGSGSGLGLRIGLGIGIGIGLGRERGRGMGRPKEAGSSTIISAIEGLLPAQSPSVGYLALLALINIPILAVLLNVLRQLVRLELCLWGGTTYTVLALAQRPERTPRCLPLVAHHWLCRFLWQ